VSLLEKKKRDARKVGAKDMPLLLASAAAMLAGLLLG